MRRFAPPQHRAYTYKVTVQPAESAVTLATFKEHIKEEGSTDEDALLQRMLNSAIASGEKLTRRDFIQRTYKTFRDFFPFYGQNEGYYTAGFIPSRGRVLTNFDSNVGFEIRKSPLVSVTEIKYQDNKNVEQTVDASIFYNTVEDDYSEILTNPDQLWPEDVRVTMQVIEITFICGLAANATTFESEHPDLTEAILDHAASMWANRGDCDGKGNAMPAQSKSIYLQCRIENL